ncbi:MAG: 2-oxoacid:acceptor oxidoreductase family protein [Kiritimatiellaeota bacterium]|nr:2-oxoacid:acceptor oxidoreductase family protein [Kiritimatiellota bacterium]
MATKILKTVGMYDTFDRMGRPARASHYCAGCGHGILHKLITEALVDLGLQDRAVMVNPIGCAVFGYYYWDVGNIGAAHGRAPAIATAVSRCRPDAITLAYQGDGDLGAIGFNNTFQAASRGERMATFFVNNAIYGMTGGQMAPTSLLSQKTATSPFGRDPLNEGYPLHVCEVLSQLKAPVYVARCSLADTKRIMQSRAAVRKALEIQRDNKGYAFVEFLSPCPTNFGMDSLASAAFVANEMEKEFPLGVFRDAVAEAAPREKPASRKPATELFPADTSTVEAREDPNAKELRFKLSGFGGQGILSLGICIAEAGRYAGRFTTWLPSYGPEQRGGSASCSVVVAGRGVGSPSVDAPDVLVCMNQPSYERFAPTVAAGGTLVVDATVPIESGKPPAGVRVVSVPAIQLAQEQGVPKAANTVMLGALAALNVTGLPRDTLLKALADSFYKKPALVPKNEAIFKAAEKWCAENIR